MPILSRDPIHRRVPVVAIKQKHREVPAACMRAAHVLKNSVEAALLQNSAFQARQVDFVIWGALEDGRAGGGRTGNHKCGKLKSGESKAGAGGGAH
jgi:hypothetical protein